MTLLRVEIPEDDWTALRAFVTSQPVPFGIEASVRDAERAGSARIVAFRSADAVQALIDAIVSYASTWELPWAVPLNRVLPRLYRSIRAGL